MYGSIVDMVICLYSYLIFILEIRSTWSLPQILPYMLMTEINQFLAEFELKMVSDIGLNSERSEADTTRPSRTGLGRYFEP